MSDGWTTDRVLQLSPDAASAKAGQGLANPRKWVSAGRAEGLVWGECQGSGANPYQVQFDLNESASKCSCPSRKFPCKHVLGLMLRFASSPEDIAQSAIPPWVAEWVGARAERAKRQQAQTDAPPTPRDPDAQADRRDRRIARIATGLAALKTWVQDLVRGGIATVPTRGYAFFDETARRMIDAQAPGIARRVQVLAETAAGGGGGGGGGGGSGWQRPFMEQLASLHLLIGAFERIAELPEGTQQDILATIGLPPTPDEPASFMAVRDDWQVIAREVELEGRLRVQRTWLLGRDSGRPALVIAFAHGTAPLDSSLASGMSFEGEVAFFPGHGIRALPRSRGALRPLVELRGFSTLDQMCDRAGEWFARNPWLDEVPVVVCRVHPLRSGTSWVVADSGSHSFPTHMRDQAGWLSLAMSGGDPIDLACAYDGRRLRPLALMCRGEYVSLTNLDSEGT